MDLEFDFESSVLQNLAEALVLQIIPVQNYYFLLELCHKHKWNCIAVLNCILVKSHFYSKSPNQWLASDEKPIGRTSYL